ncbi:hypothetical protein SAMN05421688_2311 [Poseidonocella pacifica]|uniref:Uncharacterized protein n=1 Tax=Poseidonocella pacifica TaxID=871651 RepID=A0A1I0XI05_9RHOB|nr:hypothetical protein SAMN05421688_2311 [Poseidonocella pacifica]
MLNGGTGAIAPVFWFWTVFPIIRQHAPRIAFEIIVLTCAEGVEKRNQPCSAEAKRNGDQQDEYVHVRPPSLSALSDTVMELADMASAAINGVAKPATASGTASTL